MSEHGFRQWLPVGKLLLPCEGSLQVCGCVFHGHKGKPAELVPTCNIHAPLQWGKLGRKIQLAAVSGFDWGKKWKINCEKLKTKTLKAVILMYLKCFMVLFQLQLFETQTSER